jgi:hypothetical protein
LARVLPSILAEAIERNASWIGADDDVSGVFQYCRPCGESARLRGDGVVGRTV